MLKRSLLKSTATLFLSFLRPQQQQQLQAPNSSFEMRTLALLAGKDSNGAADYEEQKKNSILEFCKEDARSITYKASWTGDEYWEYSILNSVPPNTWEEGKNDFAIQLYENDGKTYGKTNVPIIDQHVFKMLWRAECLRREKKDNPSIDLIYRYKTPASSYVGIGPINCRCELTVQKSSGPIVAPTLLKHPTDAIPSIVSNIKLIGAFPTKDLVYDPLWQERRFHYEDNFLGFYRVFEFDITVADGSVMKLTAVVNDGDDDRGTGFFGRIFIRDSSKMVAQVFAGGDCSTRIDEVTSNLDPFVPFAESDLDLPPEEEFGDWMNSKTPGVCKTQFEKIMGMVLTTVEEAHRIRIDDVEYDWGGGPIVESE